MVLYECSNCKKNFYQKIDYTRHVQVNKCKLDEFKDSIINTNHICDKCGEEYTDVNHKWSDR